MAATSNQLLQTKNWRKSANFTNLELKFGVGVAGSLSQLMLQALQTTDGVNIPREEF